MKKVLGIFILIISLSITGCRKLSEEVKIEVPAGSITSICTKKQKEDNYTVKVTTTSNYDSNHDIINMKIESLYSFDGKEKLDIYVGESKSAKESITEETDIKYDYAYDEKSKKLYTVLVYTKFSLINEIKPRYNAKEHIKTLEDSGEKCKLVGITRSELGLSK